MSQKININIDREIVVTGVSRTNEMRLGSFQTRIDSRFGSQKFYKAHSAVAPSDAALVASLKSLEQSNLDAGDLDFVISCTQTPDINNPGMVSFLLAKLGLKNIAGLEIKQSSCGPIFALDFASKLIKTGQAKTILVVCTDFLSRYFNQTNPDTNSIFGDGSAAFIVIEKSRLKSLNNPPSFKFLGAQLNSYAQSEHLYNIKIPGSQRLPQRLSVQDILSTETQPQLDLLGIEAANLKIMPENIFQAGRSFKINLEQIKYFFNHQLCAKHNQAIAAKLDLCESQFFDCFDSYGHCGSAGVILALLDRSQNLKSADVVCLSTLAAGLSSAVAFLGAI